MILFFDTETTGLVQFKLSDDNPEQPRLVQLAYILCDDSGKIVSEYSDIVAPCGYSIPDGMVHGITNEYALKHGDNIRYVLDAFNTVLSRASLLVAHNYKFDKTIINREYSDFGERMPLDITTKSFCTMLESTMIVGLKQHGSNRPKWPRLEEAYHFFFNEELKDAHDAMADCRATKRIYFEALMPTNKESLLGANRGEDVVGVSKYNGIEDK